MRTVSCMGASVGQDQSRGWTRMRLRLSKTLTGKNHRNAMLVRHEQIVKGQRNVNAL